MRLAETAGPSFHCRVKATVVIVAGLLLAVDGCSQGYVRFWNVGSTSFRIWTNNVAGTASNLMSGTNAYRFGFYAAPGAGQPSSSLELVGVATNYSNPSLNGFFSYPGGEFIMPAPYASGDTITFQIRGWTLGAGNTYEEAIAAQQLDPLNVALGVSGLGRAFLDAPPGPVFSLFSSTIPGYLSSGFEIRPIPEPSAITLALLGVATCAVLCRRRKR